MEANMLGSPDEIGAGWWGSRIFPEVYVKVDG